MLCKSDKPSIIIIIIMLHGRCWLEACFLECVIIIINCIIIGMGGLLLLFIVISAPAAVCPANGVHAVSGGVRYYQFQLFQLLYKYTLRKNWLATLYV